MISALQIFLIIVTLTAFGFGVYGVTKIETDYDSIWYMEQDSYQTHFYSTMTKLFPENGERVEIYVGKDDTFKKRY